MLKFLLQLAAVAIALPAISLTLPLPAAAQTYGMMSRYGPGVMYGPGFGKDAETVVAGAATKVSSSLVQHFLVNRHNAFYNVLLRPGRGVNHVGS
jgi:hypothetical protein